MELNIEKIEVLLLVAAIVAMLARRFHLPYTVGLTLTGLGLALAHTALDVTLTKELIFTAFLPPLIFEAAFHMQWRELRVDLPVVLLLATVGVLIGAGITAGGIYFFIYAYCYKWFAVNVSAKHDHVIVQVALQIEGEFLQCVGAAYIHHLAYKYQVVDHFVFGQQFVADAYQLAGFQAFYVLF